MKNLFFSYFVCICFACTSQEKVVGKNEVVATSVKTIVPEGDVSDMALYKPTPYFQDGAGYIAKDFKNLPKSRNITFSKSLEEKDSHNLEKIINELSRAGGGNIFIPSGNYLFKNIALKSNIHITFDKYVVIHMDNSLNGKGFLFNIGATEKQPIVENVKLVGLGSPSERPKLYLEKNGKAFRRAIALGHTKNVLVQNFSIYDEFTKGTAIAFNPVRIDEETAHIPENVTIANISMKGASIGYGLAQTNTGRNILLKNLICEGGMTCRIEAHTGRHLDLGVYNISIKNVVSKNGKAAVLLQPHSVVNGRVLVDVAKSEGSSWTLFLKEGFVAKDSKRRAIGTFDASSTFKNISLISKDATASLSFKNFKYVPAALQYLYYPPTFVRNSKDVNHVLTSDGLYSNESPITGPSVAVIFSDISYPLNIPKTSEIVLKGVVLNRLKLLNIKK
ncbi:glycoside hydrolase family protein [Flavicella sediminum]|uniref:hypothetical protein n=1 Tax=Flavicella sediminum TaxID=2585141 RepID=UPI00111CE7A0|nr:hypothetical protein [Flavicella sediminum]